MVTTLADRLIALRKERRLTQRGLAALTNGAVSASAISRLESASRDASARTLVALAKALQVRLERLLPSDDD